AEPLAFDLEDMAHRMSRLDVSMDLRRVGVRNPEDLLTYFILGPREVERFTGDGMLNTDDNALIEFQAPKSLHYETRGVNVALLRQALTLGGDYVPTIAADDARRRHAVAMAEAFARRRMWQRATSALAWAPGLADSDEGRELQRRIEEARRVVDSRSHG